MEIYLGNEKYKKDGVVKTAIIEYQFDDYSIYVYQGDISSFDIIVKYKKDGGRQRQPKHIHWAVDMLLKLQANKKLAQDFLNEIHNFWIDCRPLLNNDFQTLKDLIEEGNDILDISIYSDLNNYGEYPVEFLYILLQLLAVQEKTNRNDAYMFGNVVNALMEDDLDIFSIVSSATFSR